MYRADKFTCQFIAKRFSIAEVQSVLTYKQLVIA